MKIKGVFLAAILTAVLCISGNIFAVLSGGGTQKNPYLIQSRTDFDVYANPANSATYWASGVYTKLMCNLSLSGTPYTQAVIAPDTDIYDEVGEFQGTPFMGVFDGNGHTISNMGIIASERDFVGLFGAVGTDGQIMNLGLENVNIAGRSYVGGLAGYHDGSLTGCHVSGSVSGVSDMGGLLGWNQSGTLTECYSTATCHATGSFSDFSWVGGLIGHIISGSLTNCYATGSVTGTQDGVGGLVGWDEGGTLTGCSASGSVSGRSSVGGLEGASYDSSLSSCYATGSVTGTGGSVGGLMGGNHSWILTGCYATGSVVGGDHVGGLIGYNYSSPITTCHATGPVSGTYSVGGLVGTNISILIGCYATGTVTGTGASVYLGGLMGRNGGTLVNCYAIGSVSGGSYVGGLMGYEEGGQVSSCYATGSAGGTDYVGGLAGEFYSSTLTNSYATGSVTSNGTAGGLVGANEYSSLTDCYATGLVTGTSSVGGLVGYNNSSTLTACFWDINTSGTIDGVGNVVPDPAGVTGKTTVEMKTLLTFTSPPASWDFSTTDGDPADWMMLRPGQDYPRLAWQTLIAGDIAGLYGVNFVDYAAMVAHWRQTGCPTGCVNADINGDGTVNMRDLKVLADNWLAGM